MVTKVNGTSGIEFPDASAQATAALTAFIGTNQTLASNGYQKLPGGLIIQWGTANTGAANIPASTNFPIPFPTTVLHVLASIKSNIGTNAILNMVTNTGLTQVTLAATAGPVACSYIAIGY